jgi:hypothetical protein
VETSYGVRVHTSTMVDGRKVPLSVYYVRRGKDGQVRTSTKPHNAALMTEGLALEAGMGTKVEWSHVALFVAAIAVGIVCLELVVELAGVKNNPRESLVYLRHGVLLSLFFGMMQVFQDRLLHGVLLLFVVGVALAIVASGIVNRRFSRASKAS